MASSGGSGKDTVANIMVKKLSELDRKCQKYALSYGIYGICTNILQDKNKIKRHHLQGVGESMRNVFGKNVWIDDTDKRIKDDADKIDDCIITDIRKLVEFSHYFVDSNFIPIYVKVKPEIAKQRLAKRDGQKYEQSALDHKVEKELNFIDVLPTESTGIKNVFTVSVPNGSILNKVYVVENNETYEQLESSVSRLVKMLVKEDRRDFLIE